MKTKSKKVSIALKMQILSAVDYAPGDSIRERIQSVATRTFTDVESGRTHQFTWRTISTWVYRYKKDGICCLESKTRTDKNTYRKIPLSQLAEAIKEVLPSMAKNKVGVFVKSSLYRVLLDKGLFMRSQLSPTTFYRMVRDNNLLDVNKTKKLRLSFAMLHANELWQADTMYGPSIKQADGKWRKTFLIAFIDDASRVICHGEFFYQDNTVNMVEAFRSALFKRGKPERLYFDNGANYKASDMLQACLRLDIKLSHAPVRDGAAKGKIERFFRGFRDRFLVMHTNFVSLTQLNSLTQQWIEQTYNSGFHSGIGMIPLDRFALDLDRVKFLTDDKYSREVFFREETRKVSKTNVFSINSQRYECPVDLRDKRVQVRFDRNRCDCFIVYFDNNRMGEARLLNCHVNAKLIRQTSGGSS